MFAALTRKSCSCRRRRVSCYDRWFDYWVWFCQGHYQKAIMHVRGEILSPTIALHGCVLCMLLRAEATRARFSLGVWHEGFTAHSHCKDMPFQTQTCDKNKGSVFLLSHMCMCQMKCSTLANRVIQLCVHIHVLHVSHLFCAFASCRHVVFRSTYVVVVFPHGMFSCGLFGSIGCSDLAFTDAAGRSSPRSESKPGASSCAAERRRPSRACPWSTGGPNQKHVISCPRSCHH